MTPNVFICVLFKQFLTEDLNSGVTLNSLLCCRILYADSFNFDVASCSYSFLDLLKVLLRLLCRMLIIS